VIRFSSAVASVTVPKADEGKDAPDEPEYEGKHGAEQLQDEEKDVVDGPKDEEKDAAVVDDQKEDATRAGSAPQDDGKATAR
jgi:hypothetical protein